MKSSFADAAGGVSGSLVALLAFYPIDVIKINLQAGKSSSENEDEHAVEKDRNLRAVLRRMRSKYPSNLEFMKALFKGFHLKVAHTTASSFAYFFIYSWIQSKHKIYTLSSPSRKSGKYQPSTSMRLLLSAVAAMCNVTLTLPLDVLASRSQVMQSGNQKNIRNEKNSSFESECEDFEEEKKDDGITSTHSSQRIMDNVWKNVNDIDSDGDYDTANEDITSYRDVITMGSEDKYNAIMCEGKIVDDDCASYASSDNGNNFAIDRDCGQVEDPIVKPIFRVDTLTQPFPKHLVHTLAILNKTKREDVYKLTELWRGIRPSLLLCTNPSIHFTVYDSMKDFILKHKGGENLSMGEAFVIGIVAKFAATIATYPLIRAKVMLMVANKRKINDSNETDDTMMGILKSMFAEGGVVELYKGCSLQLVHTLLKSALLMMVRERITRTTRKLILG